MKLSELIEQLEDIRDSNSSIDPEVRIATQPSWPMESEVSTVLGPDPYDDEKIVHIAASGTTNYLSGSAARALGWQ